MYVLAKRVEDGKDAWTIHGITDLDQVSEAWMAAGHSVFDISLEEPVSFDYYAPLQPPEEDTDD